MKSSARATSRSQPRSDFRRHGLRRAVRSCTQPILETPTLEILHDDERVALCLPASITVTTCGWLSRMSERTSPSNRSSW